MTVEATARTAPKAQNGDTSHHDSSGSEPIAIIGMACRLPGGVSSSEELWDFLCEGKSAQTDVPKSRFNIDAFYNPQNELPDTVAMRGGYFIEEDIRLFENSFFSVHNLEATALDPQMRKLLEVCWECLESAGVRDVDVAGKDVGCYVGNFTADYQGMCGKDPGHQNRMVTLAMSAAILSNRVSYLLDLAGPSLTLDTACSSSLYCLHLAVNALRNHECEAAFVAGSNLIQSHEQSMSIGRYGFLSRTSTCHTFDTTADGYGRADGVGAIYIKRLSDAIRDGDPIRSIIRGTAINSNGKSTSNITVPSTVGQGQVIAKAYADAGINPALTDYVECHGTGTQLGDVVEVTVLAESMRQKVNALSKPLFVGSVKTNLGHSEASSGITSIIKATMALERQWIPPTIGVSHLNPKIDWDSNPVRVVTEGRSWPTQNEVQRASINSFGFGGANGHCILERYVPAERTSSSEQDTNFPVVLPISAASVFSLRQRVETLSRSVRPMPLRDLSHTFSNRRSKMSCRGYLIAVDGDWRQSIDMERFQSSVVQSSDTRPLAFVFTGQGAQWAGMGKQLFHQFPVFRKTIQSLDEVLSRLPNPPEWSLKDLLSSPDISDWSSSPLCSQTACTGLQVGLVNLLKEWRLCPQYVIGHSAGEIAAAYAAGHISAARAITIAYGRGMQVDALEKSGAMIAVGLGEAEANEEIRRLELGEKVCVGCVNSPGSTTVSGDEDAINVLLERLLDEQIFARKLKTGGIAYHSHHMKAIGSSYQRYLENLEQNSDTSKVDEPSSVQMISTVHNRVVDRRETMTAEYWKTNLESPVRFQQAVETLQEMDACQFIELGPHSALELPLKQTITKAKATDKGQQDVLYLPSITRHQDNTICLLNLAGRLWCRGYDIDLNAVNFPSHAHRTSPPKVLPNLPRYSWNYGPPLWKESRRSDEYRNRKFNHDELLGTLVPGLSGATHTWRNRLSPKDVPWISDHELGGETVFPGAAYVDMALKALQQIHPVDPSTSGVLIKDMRLLSALTFDDSVSGSEEGGAIELFTELRPQPLSLTESHSSFFEFTISTFTSGQAVKRAVGLVGSIPSPSSSSPPSPTLSCPSLALPQPSSTWYRQLAEVGVNYGPTFRMLSAVSLPQMRDSHFCAARFEALKVAPDPYQEKGYAYRVHPTVFDAMLQSGLIAQTGGRMEELRGLVPTAFHEIRFHPGFEHGGLKNYEIRTEERGVAAGLSVFESELIDGNGGVLMEMKVDARRFGKARIEVERGERYPLLRERWVPALLGGMEMGLGEELGRILQEGENGKEMGGGSRGELLRLLEFASMNRCDAHVLVLAAAERMGNVWTTLGGGTAHPRFSKVTVAKRNEELGKLEGCTIEQAASESSPIWKELKMTELPGGDQDHTYDFIFVDDDQESGHAPPIDLLSPEGLLLCTAASVPTPSSVDPSIDVLVTGTQGDLRMIRHRMTDSPPRSPHPDPITIITSDDPAPSDSHFVSLLRAQLAHHTGLEPTLQPLSSLAPTSSSSPSLSIVTAELSTPLLTTLSSTQLTSIQNLISSSRKILWLTGSPSSNPDFGAARGLARAVMLESPSIDFQILNLENASGEAFDEKTATSVRKALSLGKSSREKSFLLRGGVLHVSRFLPAEDLNSRFNSAKSSRLVERKIHPGEVLEMDIGAPGQFEGLRFREVAEAPRMLNGDVEVEVKAIGINAKDVYALSGKVKTHSRTFAMDYSGVVRKIPPGCTSLAVGDRVAVSASGSFATVVTVPEACCVTLLPSESFSTMCTVPLAFMTALHALEDRGRLRRGESVLIHSAAGGLGMAAIRVAQRLGVTKIFATAGTEEKREMLVREFGLRREEVFDSRGIGFLEDVRRATGGRGVDVVLNSLTGERLHASVEACARFGRFVEIGKRDIADCGKLDLAVFGRSLTFTAFDLNDYFYSEFEGERAVLIGLLRRAIELYRERPVPEPRVFDAGRVAEAYHAFANSRRMGKIAVSFENAGAVVQVQPKRFKYEFSPSKAYLLVGGLGGVGRSIARYMFDNGARHFTFMGKSGTDRPAAQSLVESLRERGATVEVITGDIGDYLTVRKAITGLRLPLGGVVQAAMGLGESLFDTMTHDKWHSCLSPKVQGTWNLHRAIDEQYGAQLDFFLMISSLAGTMGSLAESNYCSANSFLDSFAEFRRRQGKPATALAFGTISEIGYLHEHPEIEEMLKRRGLTAITEADLLDMCDLALCDGIKNHASSGHILTGLESTRELHARKQTLPPEMSDPRVSILVHAGKGRMASEDGAGKGSANGAGGGPPPAVLAAMESKDHAATVQTVLQVLTQQLSKLILTPAESIPAEMTLANAGVDSMLAAEYRSFIFHTFKTDVPFLTLMDAQTTMIRLATRITDSLLEPTAS